MKANNQLIFGVLRAGGDVPLTTAHKMVLLVLLNHWNPERNGAVIWPSQSRIADHARMSERSARDALLAIEDLGLIKILREGHGRSGRANRYQLHPDAIRALIEPAGFAGQSVDKPGRTGKDCRLKRQDLPVEPETVAAECLNELPINALSNSVPRQREILPASVIVDNVAECLKGKKTATGSDPVESASGKPSGRARRTHAG